MANIVYASEFSADLERELDYLSRSGAFGWIRKLMEDLSEMEGLLGTFPMLGRELASEGTQALLKLRMRRAPFYVWYAYDEATGPDGPLTFLRLFHTRQQSPQPRLP